MKWFFQNLNTRTRKQISRDCRTNCMLENISKDLETWLTFQVWTHWLCTRLNALSRLSKELRVDHNITVSVYYKELEGRLSADKLQHLFLFLLYCWNTWLQTSLMVGAKKTNQSEISYALQFWCFSGFFGLWELKNTARGIFMSQTSKFSEKFQSYSPQSTLETDNSDIRKAWV